MRHNINFAILPLVIGSSLSCSAIADATFHKYYAKTFPSALQATQSTSLKPQLTQIAKKETFTAQLSHDADSAFSIQAFDALDTESISIYRPGASFIKIHFSELVLPEGAQVIVRNDDGSLQHVYGAGAQTSKTIDSENGDDGEQSFSALSVMGDSAIVEYVANGSTEPYTIKIDHIMQGFADGESEGFGTVGGSFTAMSTCGVNERKDVQCYANSHPVEFERARPVARLVINGSSLCTAWRVGSSNHLFTNNHCIASEEDAQNTEVWFNYQHTSCGGSTTTQPTIVSGAQMLKTDYTLDYTLFTVDNFNAIASFGHFGLDVREAVSQERIYIPQHGAGNPKELAIVSDQNSGNLCRVDAPRTNGRGTNTDVGYYCDTIGGSSGSPVVAASSNKVIALHHLGGCMNTGARMTLIWPQVASYFGNVIPGADNDGSTGGGGNGGSGPVALTNGKAKTGLSGSKGSEQVFVLNVPAGASNVKVTMGGGSGDADLFVKAGSLPSNSNFDCRPYLAGSSESCSLPAGTQGKVYVMVQGYSAFNGLALTGSFSGSNGGGDNGSVANSGTIDSINVATGSWKHYSLDVPAGASKLDVSISGGSGDADLYLRAGQQPTSSSYDCRPYKNGNSESCSISNVASGKWYLSVYAYSGFDGLNMDWRYE